MAQILCIESSGQFGSVALFDDSQVLGEVTSKEERSHSRLLATQVRDIVKKHSDFKSLDAIAVSSGPGSYTGLRIGVSVAKGLCFALDLPLIGVSTLEIIAHSVAVNKEDYIIPVIHARKNEVYASVYNRSLEIIEMGSPREIDASSFQDYRQDSEVLFCGDGSHVINEIIQDTNYRSEPDIFPYANKMGEIAIGKWNEKDFEDLDNFEPEYLKPVYTTKPKNPLGSNG